MQDESNQSDATQPGVVDWSGLEAQIGDDPEVLREIVEAYTTEMRENLDLIAKLVASDGDVSEVRRRAHTLKGALRLFGADEAAQHALELERQAETDLSGADAMCTRIEGSTRPVLAVLDAYVATGRR